jgi:hypothetical protein
MFITQNCHRLRNSQHKLSKVSKAHKTREKIKIEIQSRWSLGVLWIFQKETKRRERIKLKRGWNEKLTMRDALPSPKLGPKWTLVFKTAELWGFEGTLVAFSIKRGRGVCWSSGMGLGKGKNFSYLLEHASRQPTSWLIRILKHLWC